MSRYAHPGLIALFVCFLIPQLPGVPSFWLTLGIYIGLYSIVGVGLVVLTGVAGVTSFGQAMFAGLGAYTTAILTTRYGISPWLTLPVALAITGLISWMIGVVTLRLSGHYLPLATIAWNISFFYLLGNADFFGRYDGVVGVPPLAILQTPIYDVASLYYLVWGAVALVIVLTQNLLNSRIGRSIRALKGGAIAAESLGVKTSNARMVAFVYAAVLAAISGWFYAHVQRAISPSPFNLNMSIEYLLMVVVGGVGSVWGAVLGAGVVTVLKDLLQSFLSQYVSIRGNFEIIVFGLLLVVMLQTAKEGLWPQLARIVARWRGTLREPPRLAPLLQRRAIERISSPSLDIRGLTKAFGGLVAVNDVNFAVGQGQIVGLIGPNGAGKSTTFDLATGIIAPTAGVVYFRGREITGHLSRQIAPLGIARTFQHVRLVSSMTTLENVALGTHLRGRSGPIKSMLLLDRAEERRIMFEAYRQLQRVGLADHWDRPATSLALGQQRVVEIARALCLDPSLLLLDEPAAGLRYAEKQALQDLLRKIRGEGISILLVEHDMDFVMGLVDRLVVMNFGAKLADGTPTEIRCNPSVIEAYLGGVT
ncbi:ABC transporter permease subunit [Pseudolabrys sp.]|uniref:branched-chain amino acid ABC transporter ATP-binding protein/permease n=1 Tax=Pseudolabrys sp. TaxID=1960880 RepID=UPI003D0DC3A8